LFFFFFRASEEGLRKLQAMEEAFTKLKQVTGVKNVEEMHEKFSTQKSNKLQLELEVKDAEHRLASAKKSFQKLETTFQELKSSGSGFAELNRDNINRYEPALSSLFVLPYSRCCSSHLDLKSYILKQELIKKLFVQMLIVFLVFFLVYIKELKVYFKEFNLILILLKVVCLNLLNWVKRPLHGLKRLMR
jgi:hypothetical protein